MIKVEEKDKCFGIIEDDKEVVPFVHYSQCCVNKDVDKHPIEEVNETIKVDDDIRNVPLVICRKCGSSEMYQYTKLLDKCEDCGHTQNY